MVGKTEWVSVCCGEAQGDQCSVCLEFMEYEGICLGCDAMAAPRDCGNTDDPYYGEARCIRCLEWGKFTQCQ